MIVKAKNIYIKNIPAIVRASEKCKARNWGFMENWKSTAPDIIML